MPSSVAPSRLCVRSSGGENSFGQRLVGGTDVDAVEPDQVVDAHAVEERRGPTRAGAHPLEAGGLHRLPAPRRQAPVLPGVAERVRRDADGGVEHELLLAGPHVGAVARHHERQVAEDADAGRAPGGLPLLLGDPLQVGPIAPLLGERRRGLAHRRRVGEGQCRRPVPPRPLLVRGVDGAKRGVGVEPPRLAGLVGAERVGPGRGARQLVVHEPHVGAAQPAHLERPHLARNGSAARSAAASSKAPVVGVERRLAAERGEVRTSPRRM